LLQAKMQGDIAKFCQCCIVASRSYLASGSNWAERSEEVEALKVPS